MKYIFSIIIFLIVNLTHAQNDSLLKSFELKKNNINYKGMAVLTCWSGASIMGSAAGYGLTNSYQEKQFYIMNGAWGVVNLAIALSGLLSTPKPNSSIYDLQKSQTKIEKLFLANALLDLVYVTGGLYVKQYGINQPDVKKSQQFKGYGDAIVIQGAALFIFDTAMTLLNNTHRKKHLDKLLEKATISFTGKSIGLSYRLN